MANLEMNDKERCIFSIHGITGMLIATVLLLVILVGLTIYGLEVQNKEAMNYYKINQNIHAIKPNSVSNSKYYDLIKKGK